MKIDAGSAKFEKAQDYENKKMYSHASRLYLESLQEVDPRLMTLVYDKAVRCFEKLKDFHQAAKYSMLRARLFEIQSDKTSDYTERLKLSSQAYDGYIRAAATYKGLGDLERAAKYYAKAMEPMSQTFNNTEACFKAAQCMIELKRFEEAFSLFETAAWCSEGEVCKDTKRMDPHYFETRRLNNIIIAYGNAAIYGNDPEKKKKYSSLARHSSHKLDGDEDISDKAAYVLKRLNEMSDKKRARE